MITLHYFPGNASLTPHMLLRELGVAHQLALVDRANQAHKSAAFLAMNPNGLIPVLQDGALTLYETAAIVMHLCDRFPEKGLAPPLGSDERAHFYKWMAWLTNTLQAALLVYFFPQRWVDEGNAAGALEVQRHAEARVGQCLDLLDAEFARHGGDWLLGASFSAADLFATMLCRWSRGMAHPARARAHLGPWLARVLARPAVAATFEAEGLATPWV